MNANELCGQYISMGAPIYCSEDGTSAPPKNIRDDDPTEIFAALFDAHAAGLRRYLARRVGDAADDLVAETFLAAIAGRSSYDPSRADPRAWLYGIATNLLKHHWRQENRNLVTVSAFVQLIGTHSVSGPDEDGPARIDALRRCQQLGVALAELAQDDRDVLLLSAWAQMDTVQIANTLQIPVGTVRSRMHRVRRILKARGAELAALSADQFRKDDHV